MEMAHIRLASVTIAVQAADWFATRGESIHCQYPPPLQANLACKGAWMLELGFYDLRDRGLTI